MTHSDSQLLSIFADALACDSPESRAAHVDRKCGSDAALRAEIEALLKAHDGAGDFLKESESPVALASNSDETGRESAGTIIGPYKLLEQIGEGGMGVVYMADQQTPVRRRVAVKIIKPGMDTRKVIARFEAERQALALMDHPNIARVLEAGATNLGRPYFVMELVRGVPITEYCDEKSLPVSERLELFVQVCQAVQHAHQKGIIHRDLKPTNVLVTMQDGRPTPKIIDFGVAKATGQQLTEKTLFTAFAQMVGTPLYMSPEQAEMASVDIDTRSDIYSLGVLLYELLTGTTPFEQVRLRTAAFDEIRRIIREEEPPHPSARLSTLAADIATTVAERHRTDPRRLVQSVRGELDWIVMKCLDKDRNQRYDTANSLVRDIERYLNDEAVHACPPSASYRIRKFARRNRTLLAAGGAVAAALVVGLGLSTFLFFRERAAVRIALANEAEAQLEAAKSQQVAQFMTDMLKGVGPSVALGRDTTMLREVLDQTSERLHVLDDQPKVEAELRTTLGNVYCDLGQYKSAEAAHREALALRQALFGDEHLDVAASLQDLGEALRKQDRFSEAEPLLRQALEIRRKLLGEENLDVAQTLFRLGLLFNRQGDGSRAEPFFRQSLALKRKLVIEEHPDFASSLGELGIALAYQGKYEEAEAVSRQAMAVLKKVLGNEHPILAHSLHNLGRILRQQGKLEEAETMLRQALAMRRKILGNEHSDVAGSLKELAQTLRGQGKLDELDAMNREILTIQRKTLGDEHIDVVKSLQRLVSVLRAQGKLNEAEVLFREALTIRRKLPVDADPSLEHVLEEFAELLTRQRKYAEAEALLREAIAIRRTFIGNENPMLARRLFDLAFVLCAQGKLPEAKPLYREAIALLKKGKVEQSKVNPGGMNGLAWMLATDPEPESRDAESAVEIAKQAVELVPDNGMIWNTLGVAHYRAGDWKAAIAALDKSMALRNGGDSSDFFFLAMAHRQLGEKDKARKRYEQAVEWMDKNQPDNEVQRRFRAEATELLGLIDPANSIDRQQSANPAATSP